AEGGAKDVSLPDWEAQLLGACETHLSSCVRAAVASGSSASSKPSWNEQALQLALFTLGEVVLQHQSYNAKTTVSPSVLQLVQTFVAPTIRRSGAKQQVEVSADASQAESSSASLRPSSSGADMPLSPSLRAHAFLALGKLMLRSETLAK